MSKEQHAFFLFQYKFAIIALGRANFIDSDNDGYTINLQDFKPHFSQGKSCQGYLLVIKLIDRGKVSCCNIYLSLGFVTYVPILTPTTTYYYSAFKAIFFALSINLPK